MTHIHRRRFVCQLANSGIALILGQSARAQDKPNPARAGMTLGFSTYGMKTLATERAVEVISRLGYDAVEFTVWPDWDAAPGRMSKIRRRNLRQTLSDKGLKLTSLMEHISPAIDTGQHRMDLERLRGVFQLAQDLAPDAPPIVQTVLGSGRFEDQKDRLRDRVGDWVQLGKKFGIATCIKPHRGGVVSHPGEAIWILRQLNEVRWARMVYDYSHYIFRDIPFVQSIRESLPYIAHVAVKDTVRQGNRTAFRLPGEAGTIDYVTLLRELAQGGYTGDISCEVSGMVWSQPGYDPLTAAGTCYQNLSAAFMKADIRRG